MRSWDFALETEKRKILSQIPLKQVLDDDEELVWSSESAWTSLPFPNTKESKIVNSYVRSPFPADSQPDAAAENDESAGPLSGDMAQAPPDGPGSTGASDGEAEGATTGESEGVIEGVTEGAAESGSVTLTSEIAKEMPISCSNSCLNLGDCTAVAAELAPVESLRPWMIKSYSGWRSITST